MSVGRKTYVACIEGKPPAPPEWWLAYADAAQGYFNLKCLVCQKNVQDEGPHQPGRWMCNTHRKWVVWYEASPEDLFVISARRRIDAEKADLHPDVPRPAGKWKLYFDERTQTPYWHQESSSRSVWELPLDAEVEVSDEDEDGLPSDQELQKWTMSDYYGQL